MGCAGLWFIRRRCHIPCWFDANKRMPFADCRWNCVRKFNMFSNNSKFVLNSTQNMSCALRQTATHFHAHCFPYHLTCTRLELIWYLQSLHFELLKWMVSRCLRPHHSLQFWEVLGFSTPSGVTFFKVCHWVNNSCSFDCLVDTVAECILNLQRFVSEYSGHRWAIGTDLSHFSRFFLKPWFWILYGFFDQ